MTLTREHLPTLRKLRDRIETGHSGYMCIALGNFCRFGDLHALQVLQHIEAEFDIRNYTSVGSWIVAQIYPGVPINDLPEPYYGLRRRRADANPMRLAFLDRTIANIEAQP